MLKMLVTAVLIMGLFSTASALDIRFSGNAGITAQQGEKPAFMYAAGFDMPVVQKDSAGFKLVAEVQALYSDRFLVGIQEITGYRIFAYGTKDFGFFGKGFWEYLYIGVGTGTWRLANTTGNDETLSAHNMQIGIMTKGFKIAIGGDVVPIQQGPDIYFPHISVLINI